MRPLPPLLAMLLVLLPAPASAEPGPYLPPQNLQWNQTGADTVELAWEPPLDADASTTYNVYRGDELLANTPATQFTGTFAGPTLFRVVAVHPNGDSGAKANWQSSTRAVWGVESVPAWAVIGVLPCSPILVSTFTQPPWVAFTLRPECFS